MLSCALSFITPIICFFHMTQHLTAVLLGNALARKAQLRRDPKTNMVE